MTPKDKAEELVNKFSDLEDGEMYIGKAKQCALIAINEILNAIKPFGQLLGKDYWEEVKQEIEKL